MASNVEENIVRALRSVLDPLPSGAAIEASGEFQKVLDGLEYFIPELLRELHQQWEHESLDGILPFVARKAGPREAEIIGVCILISDQTTTPIHVQIQAKSEGVELSWMECRLGESRSGEMVRTPYAAASSAKLLADVVDSIDTIKWSYAVGFGEREAV